MWKYAMKFVYISIKHITLSEHAFDSYISQCLCEKCNNFENILKFYN